MFERTPLNSKREIFINKSPELENKFGQLGLSFLLSIPPSELWRLPVDGQFHESKNKIEHGPFGYENREKNSIQNFLRALLLTEDLINAKVALDINLLKKIHATCREGIESLRGVPAGEFITKENHGYPLYQLSLFGANTLIEFASTHYLVISPSFMTKTTEAQIINAPKMQTWLKQKSLDSELLYLLDVNKEKSEYLVSVFLTEFNKQLKNAKNDDDLITAIVDAAYKIEHLHPFADVNLRTVIAFINLVLMKYGFPPVMYYDPNFLDGCSKSEFFGIIKDGMITTLNVITNPDTNHFNFSSTELDGEQKQQYEKIIEPVIKQLNNIKYKPAEPKDIEKAYERIRALKNSPEPEWILNNGRFNDQVASKFSIFNDNESFTMVYPMPPRKKKLDNVTEKKLDNVTEMIEAYKNAINEILDSNTAPDEKFKLIRELGNPHSELISGTGCTLLSLSQEAGASEETLNHLRGPSIMSRRI